MATMTYRPSTEDKTITAPDGTKWTSTRPRYYSAAGIRPDALLAAARRAAAELERQTIAAAAARAAARLAARNRAHLANIHAVRERQETARVRRHALAADRRELARLELIAAARAADLELARQDGGRNDADGGNDGWRPMTQRELAAAADAARTALERQRRKVVGEWNTAAAPARQAALAAEYNGTAAGRDTRRAAIHAARQHAPLPAGHRAALAAQLADGCRTQAWAGNGDTAQIERTRRRNELVTAHPFTSELLVGTDARTGRVGRAYGDGEVAGAVWHPARQVAPTAHRDDLTHFQHGRAIVLAGAETGAVRDASFDAGANTARQVVRTAAAGGGDAKWDAPGRTGQVALARQGHTPMSARQAGDAIISADDERQAAAARAAAAAARAAAPASAPAPHAATITECSWCGKAHAAIVACGDA